MCIRDRCIELCQDILAAEESRVSGEESAITGSPEKLPKPKEIYDILSEYVIGQEDAKKALSVAVDVYKRQGILTRRNSVSVMPEFFRSII